MQINIPEVVAEVEAVLGHARRLNICQLGKTQRVTEDFEGTVRKAIKAAHEMIEFRVAKLVSVARPEKRVHDQANRPPSGLGLMRTNEDQIAGLEQLRELLAVYCLRVDTGLQL